MQTRVYKLYATGTSSTNAASTLTLQNNGFIQAIKMGLRSTAGTDGINILAELSFASAFLGTTNDTIGPIAELGISFEDVGTAAASVQTTKDIVIPGLYIPVVSGDRLYLNISQAGTATFLIHAYLYILI